MVEVNVGRDIGGRITVAFPYSPLRVAKVKTIDGRKWDSEKKHWVFPDSDGILQKIIQIFDNEEVNLDPAIGLKLPYLLQQVRNAVQAHHYSGRTEQTYINWIKRFIFSMVNDTHQKWIKRKSMSFCPTLLSMNM